MPSVYAAPKYKDNPCNDQKFTGSPYDQAQYPAFVNLRHLLPFHPIFTPPLPRWPPSSTSPMSFSSKSSRTSSARTSQASPACLTGSTASRRPSSTRRPISGLATRAPSTSGSSSGHYSAPADNISPHSYTTCTSPGAAR